VEFFLVPLIAIVVVTFAIYKLAAMIFHIHLSGVLLLLLVVFAWLVSLVLPGLFFQTAGFLGSVGISLVSAVGFAWLATTFDAKRQSAQMTAVSMTGEALTETTVWTPPAESANPVLPREKWQIVAKTEMQNLPAEAVVEEIVASEVEVETAQKLPVSEPEPLPRSASAVEVFAEPTETVAVSQVDQSAWVSVEDVAVISDAFLLENQELDADNEPVAEPLLLVEEIIQDETTVPVVDIVVEVGSTPAAPAEESANEQLKEVPPFEESSVEDPVSERTDEVQPASDSLEDLLEFAFAQRTQSNTIGALATFRLVRSLYADSHAMPMVVAEIVSTLQSQGRYDIAINELSETVHLPAIQQDPRLVRTFVQKMAYLQFLRDLLIERGSPFLPFEQIPEEWQEEIEQGLLTGNRVQS
jgi:hypothetical protein